MALSKRGVLRPEPYDPNAVDADGDGIVQEGTAWERPAGTGLLDELGRAITRGANSDKRPRGVQVVDRAGNKVDYKPSYGGAEGKTPAGRQSPLAAQGFRSLSEMGMPTLGDLTQPVAPKVAPSAPVSQFDGAGKRLFSLPTAKQLSERLTAQDQNEYNFLQRSISKAASYLDDPEEQQFITGSLLNAFYWGSIVANKNGTVTDFINTWWSGSQDADFNPHQVMEDMWRSGGAFLVSLPLMQLKERYNFSKEEMSEIAFNVKSWMDQKKIQAGELSDKMKASFKDIKSKVAQMRVKRDSKTIDTAEDIEDILNEVPEPSVSSFTPDGFKRGNNTKGIKPNDQIPISGVGFSNSEGFLEQRQVPVGKEVISPIDGSTRRIDSPETASNHVAEGGNLSDVPDDLLVDSILSNVGGRFRILGSGGGVNGMQRYEDETSGAVLGLKYADGRDMVSPPGSPAVTEASTEIVAELIAEQMGYEPVPMRIVPAFAGSPDARYKAGAALVTELVHNRRGGEIQSARFEERGGKYKYNTDDVSPIRMMMLDMVIDNQDRHEGNLLLEVGQDGTSTVIPIDHSMAMKSDGAGEYTSLDQVMLTGLPPGFSYSSSDSLVSKYSDDAGYAKLIDTITQLQAETKAINIQKLNESIETYFEYMRSIGLPLNDTEKKSKLASVKRLQFINSQDPKDIANKILPAREREQFMKQKLKEEQRLATLAETPSKEPVREWGDIA